MNEKKNTIKIHKQSSCISQQKRYTLKSKENQQQTEEKPIVMKQKKMKTK